MYYAYIRLARNIRLPKFSPFFLLIKVKAIYGAAMKIAKIRFEQTTTHGRMLISHISTYFSAQSMYVYYITSGIPHGFYSNRYIRFVFLGVIWERRGWCGVPVVVKDHKRKHAALLQQLGAGGENIYKKEEEEKGIK